MSIADARVGLKERLALTGIRAHDVWPDNVVPPAALVKPLRGEYVQVFENTPKTVTFTATVVVQIGTLEQAQRALDTYLETEGGHSIPEAVADEPTLGGRVDNAVVLRFSDYDSMEIGDVTYLGAVLEIEVMC